MCAKVNTLRIYIYLYIYKILVVIVVMVLQGNQNQVLKADYNLYYTGFFCCFVFFLV